MANWTQHGGGGLHHCRMRTTLDGAPAVLSVSLTLSGETWRVGGTVTGGGSTVVVGRRRDGGRLSPDLDPASNLTRAQFAALAAANRGFTTHAGRWRSLALVAD